MTSGSRRVLYLVVCAAPPAVEVGELVDLLRESGWAVCVVLTPTAADWVDAEQLARRTDYPVRSTAGRPGDTESLPRADAVLVAPATFNTINKWVAGIADTFALGLLCEALGLGLPVYAVPHVKPTLAGTSGIRAQPGNTVRLGCHGPAERGPQARPPRPAVRVARRGGRAQFRPSWVTSGAVSVRT